MLEQLVADACRVATPRRRGRVRAVVGLQLEVEGIDPAIGDSVVIGEGADRLEAEVVGLGAEACTCMVYGELHGVRAGAPVELVDRPPSIRVGRELLGRVLDGLGRPLDGQPLPPGLPELALEARAPHPLERSPIEQQLSLGVRALDTLVPCGSGQRLGIFAGSGVGKSSLLSMIARGSDASMSVIALIGERGREVREFLERDLGPEGLARSVVVIATSDEPPLVRLRAAFVATRIAEWFRDQGEHVVLMMDSVTRFAMAQREVGLAAGEPPATRGYPPSTFGLMAHLLERAGAGATGSITGLYTVLVEGDDLNDPIADHARSILDGHVVLSRRLATSGHFPTVDVLESISRLTGAITTTHDRAAATELRKLMAAHRDARDLIDIGAYVTGSNPQVDRAVALAEPIDAFLRQDFMEVTPADEAWARLRDLVGHGLPEMQQ
ncbi:MAG: FliI/YscN family ATPase [Acidimicrobiia bacterium]